MNINFSWYGLVYALGFVLFLIKQNPKNDDNSFYYRLYISIYAAIGAIVGGRLFYIFCYEPDYYIHHLLECFQIYKGGMSFHGGLIGLSAAVFLADKKNFWNNLDKAALIAIVVLPIGRIVNFINGELWGTPTTLPWGVVFLGADFQPRHPVQIYEAVFEGPFAALVIYALKNKLSKSGDIACAYSIFYALARFITEFFREPDIPVGYILTFFSLGQILCLIQLIVISIIFKYKNTKQKAICRKSD
ncbi:prolipoprotein diacylglyceryl transferase [Succinatimonas hippei]|uniref:prolipoprotein diacylglyceryl transferase n=1 Tax=Succinatimonas hippei TaxID=626938 RepID=UPI0026EC0262|nr:prolipoprotein diacylglyceryl transferase [Succinatimonas hippei]